MKNITVILTLLLAAQSTHAQTEFIVTVNPATGTHSIIHDLPPVNYIYIQATTFDKNGHRYFFKGKDFGGIEHLYTIDALTGTILFQPVFALNAGEFEYDNSTNTLYAIQVDATLGVTHLVSLDPATGIPTAVATLPFMGYTLGASCFDETSHTYITQYGANLYSINVNTGTVTSASTSGLSFNELKFDNTSGFVYALLFVSGSMELVRINAVTGVYTTVCSLSPGYSTGSAFDETNHRYVYNAMGYLSSIDVNTGTTLYSPAFPVGLTSPQNVIEPHYDNSSGILFALHWGELHTNGVTAPSDPQNSFSLFPNPASGSATVQFAQSFNEIKVGVYDVSGRLVISHTAAYTHALTMSTAGLAGGMYMVQVVCDGLAAGPVRLMVK